MNARGEARLGVALALSVVIHAVLLFVGNQLPLARYRVVPRVRVIKVRLLYPEPVEKPRPRPQPVVLGAPESETAKGWRELPPPRVPEPALPEPEVTAELPAPGLQLAEPPEPRVSAASRQVSPEPFPLAGDPEKREVPTVGTGPIMSEDFPGKEVPLERRGVPGVSREGWGDLVATPPEEVVQAPRRGRELTDLIGDPSTVVESDEVARAVPSRKVVGRAAAPVPLEVPPPVAGGRRRIRTVEPEVPAWVEEKGIEASTTVKIEILEDGRVGNAWLLASSGYRELDNLAAAAVRQWLYEAGLKEQRAVIVHFRLR